MSEQKVMEALLRLAELHDFVTNKRVLVKIDEERYFNEISCRVEEIINLLAEEEKERDGSE